MVVSVRRGRTGTARRGWRVKRTLYAMLASAAVVLVAPAAAAACSCAEITRDSIRGDEVAIVAKLTTIEVPVDRAGQQPDTVFHFRVIEVLKGEKRISRRNVRVHDALPGSTCEMEGRVGRRYGLVLERDGHWESSLCGQTTPRQLRAVFDERRERAAPLCAQR